MLKKTKILICGVLPPPYFGHSMLYEMLMRSSFPQAYDVKFLNMHFWSYETNKKVTVEKLLKLVCYFCQYFWLLVSFRPIYVLFNTSFYKMPFLKDFLFCAIGILFGKKIVLHDHGQYIKELHDQLPSWQRNLLNWMLGHSSASIIMGERVRLFYEGLMPQAKLFVVPGTVEDTKDFSVLREENSGKVEVLYFSHLSRDKGVEVAFEAVPLILKGRKDIRVTFAGPIEGDDIAIRLEGLQKSFPGRVRYLGYIDQVFERTKIFRSADIFIFPTLRDVFGLVLLHAMAEGLPIVASREGTIPEIIPDVSHGLLFEKGSAQALAVYIHELVMDEPRRRAMGAANRLRFEQKYSLEKYSLSMIETFERIE